MTAINRTSDGSSNQSRRDVLLIVLAFLLVGAISAGAATSPLRINHDCAYYLQMAEALLDGGVPYCDFVDTNPPLIIYLSVVPVLIARTLGISVMVAFQATIITLLVLSSLELYFLIQNSRSGLRRAGRALILLTWISLYLLVDSHGDMGQREYLFMLLYMPYLFLRILRHRGGTVAAALAVLLGLQAGIGVSLKPHFLICAAAVELALLMLSRRWRLLWQSENIALAAVVAAYVLHWLFVPTAMREAFFGRWMPLIAAHYDSFNMESEKLGRYFFKSFTTVASLAILIVAVPFCRRRSRGLQYHLLAFAVLAVVAVGMFFLQHKGWSYHRIPFEFAGFLCLPLLIIALRGQRSLDRRAWGAVIVALGVLVAFWCDQRGIARRESVFSMALRLMIEDHSQPGDRVLIISPALASSGYPQLLQTGRKQGSRYFCCFPIAFLNGSRKSIEANKTLYRRWDEASPEERQFLDELREDVERLRPRLIIIQDDVGCAHVPKDFNPFEYLVYAGWTESALESYRELPGAPVWRLFQRKDP